MALEGKKTDVPLTESKFNTDAEENTDNKSNNDLANDKSDCETSDPPTMSNPTTSEAAVFSGAADLFDPRTIHVVCVFLRDFIDDMSGAFLMFEYFIEAVVIELRDPNLSRQRRTVINAQIKIFLHHLCIIIHELKRVKRRESNANTAVSNWFAQTEEGSKDERIKNYKYIAFVMYEEAMDLKKILWGLLKTTDTKH